MCLASEFELHTDGSIISKRSGKAVTGSVGNHGYRVLQVGSKKYLYHRVKYFLVHGTLPSMLDHRDGARLNNDITNLRPATSSLNNHNVRRKNATGVKGVYLKTRYGRTRYRAKIVVQGKGLELGLFDDLEEARSAYNKAAEKYYATN